MKSIEELYFSLKNTISQASGAVLSDGGDMALRLRALAAELFSLWSQADFVLRQSFPQTAEGSWLDNHAQVRGLVRRESVCAQGVLRFSVSSAAADNLTVPAGSECMTAAGLRFATTRDASIPAGELFCDVPAAAVSPGKAWNVPAGTVCYMAFPPVGVEACVNPDEFIGGTDAENDDELRARVLASYRTLPNGANVAYYETLALGIDGVRAVKVLPKNRGIGTVDIVIAGTDGLPADDLVDAVQAAVNDCREICVDALVYAPETVPVTVDAAVTVKDGYDAAAVLADVEQAVRDWFSGERLGQDVLLAALSGVIYSVPGVYNYSFTAPMADVPITASQLPVLDAVTVTEA